MSALLWTDPARRSARPGSVTAVLVLLALLTLSGGCSLLAPHEKFTVPDYVVGKPTISDHSFLAGVGKSDITPPPGFPTGGHGPAGNLARGQWGRLYARAFFFRDSQGHALLMVSCDFFAMPAGLRAVVARKLALQFADRVALPPEAVVLAATHTHQGPGNFVTAATMNQYGSSYPGFSRPLFDFLADQIAAAGAEAIETALRSGESATLFVHTGRFESLLRNRSPLTFMLNRDRAGVLSTLGIPEEIPCVPIHDPLPRFLPDEPTDGWNVPGCPRLRAANPTATILEIKRGTRRIGALVFFAAHPTVLAHRAPLYSADFTGVALTRLERQSPGFVAGFFNGPEGDVTARRIGRDFADVERLAQVFAKGIERALCTTGEAVLEPSIAIRAQDVDVTGFAPAACTLGSETRRLSEAPTWGAAALGGGEGDRTILYALGWCEGVRDRPLDGQGPKLPGLNSQLLRFLKLTPLFAPKLSFPRSLPLTYVTLGSFAIATLPSELSTTQGLRLRLLLDPPVRDTRTPEERLREGLRSGIFTGPDGATWLAGSHKRLAIVGLANEFIAYTATADEYAAQDYMAAATAWGPGQGDFFGCSLAKLKDATPIREARFVPEIAFNPGPAPDESFGPRFLGDPRHAPGEELESLLVCGDGAPDAEAPWFAWSEILKDDGSRGATAADFEATRNRSVEIWEYHGAWRPRPDGAAIEDDRGSRIVTVLLGAAPRVDDPWNRCLWGESCAAGQTVGSGETARLWGAIWRPPDRAPGTIQYLFKVTWSNRDDNNAWSEHETCSVPFRIEDPQASGANGLPVGMCPLTPMN